MAEDDPQRSQAYGEGRPPEGGTGIEWKITPQGRNAAAVLSSRSSTAPGKNKLSQGSFVPLLRVGCSQRDL